jgi:HJR/Mrr/RecB family endonuclease
MSTLVNNATFAVQAKCWSKPVGPEVVRELAGSPNCYPAGTVGIIVTTSRFTGGASEEAHAQGIELIDGAEFLRQRTAPRRT